MIQRLLLETMVVPDLHGARTAWTDELGWEAVAQAETDEPFAKLWGLHRPAHPRFAILRAPGSTGGHVRLLEGPAGGRPALVDQAGLFNAEMMSRDVDALYERVKGSAEFRPVSAPRTYDLRETGAAVSRSFATRLPGGGSVFFTQLLEAPTPRVLPTTPHLAGPVFNGAVATDDQKRVEAFYEGVLGMTRRFDMRIDQKEVSEVLGLSAHRPFRMVVFKGEGDGLVELDVHEGTLVRPAAPPEGQLAFGNAGLTLETGDFRNLVARASAAGALRREGGRIPGPPYHGRRAAILEGPAGEVIEVVEA